jgi:uncharacterized protein YjiS (DUF1127 family)
VQEISRTNQPLLKDFAGDASIACFYRRLPRHSQHTKIGVSDKTAGFSIIGGINFCCQIRPRARRQAAAGNRTSCVVGRKQMMEMTMSTMFTAPTAAQGIAEPWIGRLAATLKQWWLAYITWRIEQAAIAQLWVMSDRELKDIGLTRCEITRAVRREVGDRLFGRSH